MHLLYEVKKKKRYRIVAEFVLKLKACKFIHTTLHHIENSGILRTSSI